jgi:23S rRNA (pseudouridine1915-N3)-methyltransferase
MQIYLIAVGKVKERYLREGIGEYVKRLHSYVSLRILEVPDEHVPPHPTEAQKESAREKEGAALLAAVPSGAWVIALQPSGKEISSKEFAERIRTWEVEGPHSVAFLIGGELGISSTVLAAADLHLSLSRMTFPHQMVRFILLEALYRAFRQMRGEPYAR